MTSPAVLSGSAVATGEAAPRRSYATLRVGVLAMLALALAAAMLAGLTLGRFSIAPARLFEIVAAFLADPTRPVGGMDERIALLVRLPRVILAALAGAGLAASGAALQGVFRNPLVAPQILGISPGAAFGGALAIMLGWTGMTLLGLSFGMGLAALILVGFLARIDGRSEPVTIILAGLVIGALFGALLSLLQFLANPNGTLPAIVYWLMGSFATATWERLGLALPGLGFGLVGLVLLRFRLNVLSLDDAEARSLGANPERERWLVFVLVSLIVGSQVAVSGVVGWVGLVVPHMMRFIVGSDHRALVPASALGGAALLVLVDTVARTATAAEIPLGILTAIIGAPVFAWLLRRHYRERTA